LGFFPWAKAIEERLNPMMSGIIDFRYIIDKLYLFKQHSIYLFLSLLLLMTFQTVRQTSLLKHIPLFSLLHA